MANRILTIQEFEASLKKILAETKPKRKGGKKQPIRKPPCPGGDSYRNRFA